MVEMDIVTMQFHPQSCHLLYLNALFSNHFTPHASRGLETVLTTQRN